MSGNLNILDKLFFDLVTYNLNGLSQGKDMLDYICNSKKTDVVLIQEHWLTPSNMNLIYNFSESFITFGVSAMTCALEHSILRGRPYGGVATLVNKRHVNYVKCCKCSEYFVIVLVGKTLIVNLYLPCKSSLNLNLSIIEEILSDIAVVLETITFDNLIIGGDFNCNMFKNSPATTRIKAFISRYKLHCCAAKNLEINGRSIEYTYCHKSLGYKSYIDFFYVSENFVSQFKDLCVIDVVPNDSDHEPILARFNNIVVTVASEQSCPATADAVIKAKVIENLRWDKADTNLYYYETLNGLTPILNELHQCNLLLLEDASPANSDPGGHKFLESAKLSLGNVSLFKTLIDKIDTIMKT
jgi:exonuclease III